VALRTVDPGEIEQLRARMRRMEQAAPGREIATHPALTGAVRLRGGGAYRVDAGTLAMALLAGPSAAGEWAAVVGVPDFGAEAAAELGVALDRTILVPEPGDSWLEAVAALVDVTGCVVVRPPGRVPERLAEKIGARLRTRGCALVALCDQGGDWPRAEARLSTAEPRWSGVGRGEGHLVRRRLVVEVRRGAAPPRRVPLWFPDGDGALRAAAPEVVPVERIEAAG